MIQGVFVVTRTVGRNSDAQPYALAVFTDLARANEYVARFKEIIGTEWEHDFVDVVETYSVVGHEAPYDATSIQQHVVPLDPPLPPAPAPKPYMAKCLRPGCKTLVELAITEWCVEHKP